MPIADPTASTMLDHSYIWIAEVNFNFVAKRGRIVYLVHRDQMAALAGKQPLTTIAFDITPTGSPAITDTNNNIIVSAFPSFDGLIAQNNAAIQDLAGAIYEFAISRPEVFPDASPITPPAITSVTPPTITTDPIIITFNKPITDDSLQILLTDNHNNVIPTSLVSNINAVVTLQAAFVLNTSYICKVLNAADVDNNIIVTEYDWTFSIV